MTRRRPFRNTIESGYSPDLSLIYENTEYPLDDLEFTKDIGYGTLRVHDKDEAERLEDELDGFITMGDYGVEYVVKYPQNVMYSGEVTFSDKVPAEVLKGIKKDLFVLKVSEKHRTKKFRFDEWAITGTYSDTIEFVASDMEPVLTG